MARYYPLFLNLEGVRCVVVGGGTVAARKAGALLAAGGRVTVVAEAFASAFDAMEGVERLQARFDPAMLDGARLVIAATDDEAVNQAVCAAAVARGALVNAVDRPALGNFIVPATVRRGDLVLAVSTGGACPALAARLRRELEHTYPESYGEFVDLLRRVRDDVLGTVDDPAKRKAMLERLAGPEFFAAFLHEGPRTALARMRRFVREESDERGK